MGHIVIIGNGIAGITCARNVRKQSQDDITVISSETTHFYARTALMYIYMGHMKYEHTKPYEDGFWKKNRISLVQAHVKTILTDTNELELRNGENIKYDKLVIATGSVSNLPDLAGNKLTGVQGLYNIQDLELMEANTKDVEHAVIVGGGLIGIEMAEMLLSRNIGVTMLVREAAYWGGILHAEEAAMIAQHMAAHHINLHLETELKEIQGDEMGKVVAVVTKNDKVIPCQFVGLTVGVSPNISLLKESNIATDKGVLIDKYFATNIPNVFAIGDCAQFKEALPGRKPVEQVWYTGRMHGETLALTLCGKQTAYQPGPWFNSAKFLDIEYQTYGDVPVKLEDKNAMFYWEDAKENIALRIHYEKNSNKLLGVNAFGIRLRHEVLQQWLKKNKTVEEVVTYLADAVFDPEYYKRKEKAIAAAYNKQFGKDVKPQKRSWKRLLQV